MSLDDKTRKQTGSPIGFALLVAFLSLGAIGGCGSSGTDNDLVGSDGSGDPVPVAPLPATVRGYFASDFTASQPPALFAGDQYNIWICFRGTTSLMPALIEDCPRYKTNPPPSGALIFADIGGGEKNSINRENLLGLSEGRDSEMLVDNGFSGVVFDLESVGPDFDGYEDFESTMILAIQALREQGLYSILTTSKDGISTGALRGKWPKSKSTGDDWNVTFPKFQANVVPLFDAYSPQCYSTGTETTPPICQSYLGISYDGYSGARAIWPAVSGAWITLKIAEDPIGLLTAMQDDNKTSPSALFPTAPTGYLVWAGQ